MLKRKKRREKITFEVIPLIDVIMVLCLFFCIAAFLPQINNAIDTKLPQATGTDTAKEAIVVAITESGSINIQEKLISKNELLKELKARIAKDPSIPILIAADKNLKYDKVIGVLDIVKKTGATQVGLATEE